MSLFVMWNQGQDTLLVFYKAIESYTMCYCENNCALSLATFLKAQSEYRTQARLRYHLDSEHHAKL